MARHSPGHHLMQDTSTFPDQHKMLCGAGVLAPLPAIVFFDDFLKESELVLKSSFFSVERLDLKNNFMRELYQNFFRGVMAKGGKPKKNK